jgi:hypothetical protein
MASMKPKQPDKLTNQLRAIVLESGMSLGEISRETGIDKSALSRFLSGERDVSAKVLNTLGELFQLRLMSGCPQPKGERKRNGGIK